MALQDLGATQCTEARFVPMAHGELDTVCAIEQQAYAHPWSRMNFEDVLRSGYQAQLLMGGTQVLGYFVAMVGFEEVHLLNITVAPGYQRQGWAHVMLDALDVWARAQGAHAVWLEVRHGNVRARQVYEAHGYCRVAQRKDYYPASDTQREDAIVMAHHLLQGAAP